MTIPDGKFKWRLQNVIFPSHECYVDGVYVGRAYKTVGGASSEDIQGKTETGHKSLSEAKKFVQTSFAAWYHRIH